MNTKPCFCKSKKLYSECCEKYLKGKILPKNAKDLMRSRFSAYATKNVEYIIKTSHKKNACFQKDLKSLRDEIKQFCETTSFDNLEILDFVEEKNHAFVTFIAYLKSGGKNITFTEISHFVKEDGKWLYKNGQIFEGAKKNL